MYATVSEILCPVLPNITDGVVIIVSRSVDALAVYNCSAGFEILGIDVRVCMEDGNWNGTEPICTGDALVCVIYVTNYGYSKIYM